ncbi:MAG TPA: hypothetical protein VMS60_00675 [Solirubrobacterales bacterium]|nr:hypothetical protein [Solirubrobacterales bacterium]
MRKLSGKGVIGALLGLLIIASSAFGSSHNPSKQFAQFAECPLSKPTVSDCVHAVIESGAFEIGNRSVTILNPVTLQGGFEGEGSEIKFYGAENGDTLSKTSQPVPRGMVGVTAPSWWPQFLQDWFNKEIEDGSSAVNATLELTGPSKGLTEVSLSTENLLLEKGTALGLPAKFHLENPLLGSNCYLGWESVPIQLDFTSSTDGALKGDAGAFTFNKAFSITTIAGSTLVTDSFTVPRAEGCGGIFSFFIDPLVNSVLDLPAEAGTNVAVLRGKLQDGNAEAVKKSE